MNKATICILCLLAPGVPFAGPGDIHYVKSLQADIHAGPSQESEKKFTIAIGRKLVEFDRKAGWIYVGIDKTGGKDGWIEQSQLSDTDPDGLKY